MWSPLRQSFTSDMACFLVPIFDWVNTSAQSNFNISIRHAGVLNARPQLAGVLNARPRPARVLNSRPIPARVLNSRPHPAGVLNARSHLAGILKAQPLPAGVLNAQPLPTWHLSLSISQLNLSQLASQRRYRESSLK